MASAYWTNLRNFILQVREFAKPWHSKLPVVNALMSTTKRDQTFPFIGLVRAGQVYNEPATPDMVKVDMEVGHVGNEASISINYIGAFFSS
jgi:hypothetical protein